MKKSLFFLVFMLFIPASHIISVYTPHPKQTFHYQNLILQMIQAPDKPWDVKIYSDDGKPLPVTIEISEEAFAKFIEKLKEMTQEAAPDLKESWQTIVGTLLNMENAIRFGTPITLFG